MDNAGVRISAVRNMNGVEVRIETWIQDLGDAQEVAQAKERIASDEATELVKAHYQLLKDADLDSFRQLTEQWTLDYAEQYAAAGG